VKRYFQTQMNTIYAHKPIDPDGLLSTLESIMRPEQYAAAVIEGSEMTLVAACDHALHIEPI